MGLQSEIYDFFNEARPRTKNAGVEDIERTGTGRKQRDFDFDSGYKERVVKKYEITTITDKGVEKSTTLPPFEILQIIKSNPDNKDIKFEDIKVGEKYKYFKKTPGGVEKKGEIILKSKTPKETAVKTDPQKKARSIDTNVNPEGLKSYYLKSPGAVHEISFNNVTKGVRQKVYTIYRTITEQEYKTLGKDINSKVSIYVEPSDESNHYKDVYYITIPKYKYGSRSGADYTYFMWVKEDVVKGLTKEQKDKLKLVLVPIKDISEGIDKRPLDLYTFMTFLSDKEKEKLKKTRSTKISNDDKEEPLDVDLSFLSDEEPDMGEPSDEEIPEPEVPKTVDAGDKFSKEDKAAASGFVLDNDRMLDKIKSNYSRQAKKDTGDAIRVLIDKLYNSLGKESERDAAIEYIIKNRLDKDNKGDLYKMIKLIYDNMKSLKESSFLNEEEARKKYLIKTIPGSKLDGTLINSKVAKKNIDDKGEIATGEYIISLTDTQVRNFKSAKGLESGFKSIEDYKEEPKASKDKPVDEPTIAKADEGPKYKVGLTIDGGKENVADMSVGQILKFVKSDPDNKDIAFEDIEVGVPLQFNQKMSVGPVRKGSIVLKSKSPVGQKSDLTKVLTTFRSEPGKEKATQDKVKAEKPEMKTVKQMGRFISVPVNMGVKMATINPSDLTYKYYIVDKNDTEKYPNGRLLRDADGGPLGTDDRVEAMEIAKKMGPGYSVYQKAEMKAKRVDIDEDLSKEDKKKIETSRVSFIIQDPTDADKTLNVSDTVKSAMFNKDKNELIVELTSAGKAMFVGTKNGNVTGTYEAPDKKVTKIQDTMDPLNKVLDKVFPSPANEAMESYIRKRIREAIKEAEVSQYWGYQGRDVKKKRLEEYLKKYDWGFQDSDNPYTHANGSAKHAIVSKLVHELQAMGVDAIAIFNSYAPEGYQVSDLDQLDYASDSPLGSQLTQPYNPDSLTARGGRVAEQGPVPYKGQGADQLDRLVKDMSPKLKDAVKAKADSKQAKELISVFRQVYKMADDVTDDMIYNKIKSV